MTSEAMNYPPDQNEEAVRQAVDRRLPAYEVDFTNVGPELAISYLFARLREDRYKHQHGTDLAGTVIALTSPDPMAKNSSHESRMQELRRRPISDDLWNEKSQNDPIFQLLENLLRDQKVRSLAEQRKATKQLYDLRGSFEAMTTPADSEWQDVIERLFP